MMAGDQTQANNSWSAPCDTTVHTGCQGDANRGIVALQQWLTDLNGAATPARFAAVDAQLRRHLTQSITGLNSLVVASQANDQDGMNRAFLVGLSGRLWTDTVVPGILASKQVSTTAYVDSVRTQKQSLDNCSLCQALVASKQVNCSVSSTPTCEDLLGGAADQVATFQSVVARYAAPSSLSAKDASLELDLANADSALMAMRSALTANDQARFNNGLMLLQRALTAVAGDVSNIMQG